MDSGFVILASMLAIFGSVGIAVAMMLHPAFYSSPIIIFGMLGYVSYRYVSER